MDFGKYWLGGWGLYEIVFKHITSISVDKRVRNVVEFGSGASTQFLVDLRNKLAMDYFITSFDHNPNYSYKGSHPNLSVKVRDLVTCDDASFKKMFETKKIHNELFVKVSKDRNTESRIENLFYDIGEGDIPDGVDLVILDGPFGNGRSFAFLHLLEKLSDEAYIVIDDSDHYDFIERCCNVLGATLLVHEDHPEIHHFFNFAILKVQK